MLSFVKRKCLFFWFKFLNGDESVAKLGMILLKSFTEPISDPMPFRQFGSPRFLTASALCVRGLVPRLLILKPNHSILCVRNLHFSRLIDKSVSYSVFNTLRTVLL